MKLDLPDVRAGASLAGSLSLPDVAVISKKLDAHSDIAFRNSLGTGNIGYFDMGLIRRH